jgi:uncharacterized protein DUF4115
VLRRASLRESSLPELFEGIKGRRHSAGRRFDPARASRRKIPPALSAPSSVAITGVGVIAVTALAISSWQLAHSSHAQPRTVTLPAGGVAGNTVTHTEQAPATTPLAPAKPTARLAKLVLAAARGDCWLEVRASFPAGKTLFVGILEEGQSLRFAQKRLWLAFGAGAYLDVTLNGRRVESFPSGTATVMVTAKGVKGPL